MDTKKYLFSNKDLINLILPLTVDQYLGKNSEEMACKAANELLSFTLKASLGVTILAYLGRNLMIRTFFGNIEQDVTYNCKVYMLIVFASIPMIALYNAGTSLFRAMGDDEDIPAYEWCEYRRECTADLRVSPGSGRSGDSYSPFQGACMRADSLLPEQAQKQDSYLSPFFF